MSIPITRQEYDKRPNVTTKTTTSRGDGSNLYNVTETMHGNGNVSIVSDLVTKNIVQTDNSNTVNGNNISDTQGSSSQWVNEASEISSNSSYRVVGNPANLRNGFFRETDIAKQKIIAMRSGFNDDRNEIDLIPDLGLAEMPSEIVKNVTVIDKDTALCDNSLNLPTTGNLFADIAIMAANEIAKMTEAMSKISLKSAIKQAELIAKNKVEKIQKVIENIEELPESFSKEKLKNAIMEGNFSAIFASPSNEDKEKKNVYDKDQYVAAAVDASKEMMSAERALQ